MLSIQNKLSGINKLKTAVNIHLKRQLGTRLY